MIYIVLKMTAFWDMKPFSLIEADRRFRGASLGISVYLYETRRRHITEGCQLLSYLYSPSSNPEISLHSIDTIFNPVLKERFCSTKQVHKNVNKFKIKIFKNKIKIRLIYMYICWLVIRLFYNAVSATGILYR
jgi:hypothetical protein